MTEPLSPGEYRDLLSRALEGTVDADTRPPTSHTLYMPDAHRAALYVDSTVVQGGRGVGKTFWARSLLDPALREAAAVEYGISRLRRLRVSLATAWTWARRTIPARWPCTAWWRTAPYRTRFGTPYCSPPWDSRS